MVTAFWFEYVLSSIIKRYKSDISLYGYRLSELRRLLRHGEGNPLIVDGCIPGSSYGSVHYLGSCRFLTIRPDPAEGKERRIHSVHYNPTLHTANVPKSKDIGQFISSGSDSPVLQSSFLCSAMK